MSTLASKNTPPGRGGKGAEKAPKGPFVIKGWMMVVGGLGAGLFLVGAIWAGASLLRGDPDQARIKDLLKQMEDPDLDWTQFRALSVELQEATKGLPREQSEEIGRTAFGQRMLGMEIAKAEKFFAMTPEMQAAHLDEEVTKELRDEARRNADRQTRGTGSSTRGTGGGFRGQRGGGGEGGPPQFGGGGPPQFGGGGPPGTGSGGSRSGGGGSSSDEGGWYTDRSMGKSTPEQRAKMDEYRRQKEKAKQQKKAAQSAAKTGT